MMGYWKIPAICSSSLWDFQSSVVLLVEFFLQQPRFKIPWWFQKVNKKYKEIYSS